jgi:hypothetical protein
MKIVCIAVKSLCVAADNLLLSDWSMRVEFPNNTNAGNHRLELLWIGLCRDFPESLNQLSLNSIELNHSRYLM